MKTFIALILNPRGGRDRGFRAKIEASDIGRAKILAARIAKEKGMKLSGVRKAR